MSAQTQPATYPVRLEADYPERSSRGLALLAILLFIKAVLLVPHLIVLSFVNIAAGVVAFIAYWAVLITGRYPRGMFNFVLGTLRWQARVAAWLYSITDRYPPFSLS